MSFILLGILNSQAAGAVVPEPDFLSSAPLWLDAADASTITESGGSVSQWDNKGTLENFTQATSADQPTTGTLTQNGLNVLDFNDDFLTGSTKSQWTFMHDGTEYFYCAVVKYGNVSNPDGIFSLFGNNKGGSNEIGTLVAYLNRSNQQQEDAYLRTLSNGTAGNITIQIFDLNFVTPNQFVINSDIVDPDNATAANRIDYFQNNTQGTDTNANTTAPTSSESTFQLEIGGNGEGLSTLVGQIGEFIVVSGADATEENRQIVVDYLNDKWGVF